MRRVAPISVSKPSMPSLTPRQLFTAPSLSPFNKPIATPTATVSKPIAPIAKPQLPIIKSIDRSTALQPNAAPSTWQKMQPYIPQLFKPGNTPWQKVYKGAKRTMLGTLLGTLPLTQYDSQWDPTKNGSNSKAFLDTIADQSKQLWHNVGQTGVLLGTALPNMASRYVVNPLLWLGQQGARYQGNKSLADTIGRTRAALEHGNSDLTHWMGNSIDNLDKQYIKPYSYEPSVSKDQYYTNQIQQLALASLGSSPLLKHMSVASKGSNAWATGLRRVFNANTKIGLAADLLPMVDIATGATSAANSPMSQQQFQWRMNQIQTARAVGDTYKVQQLQRLFDARQGSRGRKIQGMIRAVAPVLAKLNITSNIDRYMRAVDPVQRDIVNRTFGDYFAHLNYNTRFMDDKVKQYGVALHDYITESPKDMFEDLDEQQAKRVLMAYTVGGARASGALRRILKQRFGAMAPMGGTINDSSTGRLPTTGNPHVADTSTDQDIPMSNAQMAKQLAYEGGLAYGGVRAKLMAARLYDKYNQLKDWLKLAPKVIQQNAPPPVKRILYDDYTAPAYSQLRTNNPQQNIIDKAVNVLEDTRAVSHAFTGVFGRRAPNQKLRTQLSYLGTTVINSLKQAKQGNEKAAKIVLDILQSDNLASRQVRKQLKQAAMDVRQLIIYLYNKYPMLSGK